MLAIFILFTVLLQNGFSIFNESNNSINCFTITNIVIPFKYNIISNIDMLFNIIGSIIKNAIP